MVTELKKGILLGYLFDAPDEIRDIARSIVCSDVKECVKDKSISEFFANHSERARILRCIRDYNYYAKEDGKPELVLVNDLTRIKYVDLLKLPKHGRITIDHIVTCLAEHTLRFRS